MFLILQLEVGAEAEAGAEVDLRAPIQRKEERVEAEANQRVLMTKREVKVGAGLYLSLEHVCLHMIWSSSNCIPKSNHFELVGGHFA